MADSGHNELTISKSLEKKSQDGKKTKKNKSNRKAKIDIDTSDGNSEISKETKIKPIIKNATMNADSADNSEDCFDNVYSYRKKRNKSVSFLIEDGEQTAKKTKSNSGKNETEQAQENKPNKKKHKKDKKSMDSDDLNEPSITKKNDKTHSREWKNKSRYNSNTINATEEVPVATALDTTLSEPDDENRKKKNKKRKKQNSVSETVEETEKQEPIEKSKSKNKKSHPKAEGDGIPVKKSKNNNALPETIADDLETLKIGDNPHSLTNLLDDMKVCDKTQKHKVKIHKKSKEPTAENEPKEEVKEKTKWKKRKWNKGRTGAFDDNWMETAVIVENLPLTCMLKYKELLKEKFADVGPIKSIGIAELYPTMVSKPVFTTTVQFNDEKSATKALEEDNTLLENGRIRVLRPLEPNSTTIVVRSYGELNDQNLSSIFNGVGKIRNIRHLDKGKERRKMATTFIEFDGPDSQEKAIEVANGMKIGSKKLHVCKFQERVKQQENRENIDQNVM